MEKLPKQSLTNVETKGKMPGSKIFRGFQLYVSAAIVLVIAPALIYIIYYTQFFLQWTIFLTGILLAAILASLSRAKLVMHLTAQLASVTNNLECQIQYNKTAEETVVASKQLMNLIDGVKSLMIAFVDADGRYQYHNRAFREWLNLRPERINGRFMREVLGAKAYEEIVAAVRQSLGGQSVSYDQKKKLPNGSVVMVSIEHVPQFAEDGKVNGFHILARVITENRDTPQSIESEPSATGRSVNGIAAPGGTSNQDMFVTSFSEEITGKHDEGYQILLAIEKGEFSLFCQQIISLTADAGKAGHYEILLRLIEEEENMMPPGAFFPLAEKHGLMPYLDRWVVRHVIEYVAQQNQQLAQLEGSIFFINMSLATLVDPGFPEFLKLSLLEYDVPGNSLCFEIPFSELASRAAELAEFAQQVKQCGCFVALSGFGRDRVMFDQIHGVHVEFLKIDGSVILDFLHDPVKLAQVIAISRVAKKIGIKTVAELVESEEIIEKLREIGIDFAQGFGISRPQPLAEIR